MLTDGLAKDVEWRFSLSDKPVKRDFHIINNLPVEAILSNDFFEDFDVFSAYEYLFTKGEPTDKQDGIYGITFIKKCRSEILSLESQYLQDGKSKTAISSIDTY